MQAQPRTRKEAEVWRACEAILNRQGSLTYFAIGEQLALMGYKRGSNSDIRRYFQSWKNRQGKNGANMDIKSGTLNNTQLQTLVSQLKIYEHHVQQVERLLGVITLLKKENRALRSKLAGYHHEEDNESIANIKPRITCQEY